MAPVIRAFVGYSWMATGSIFIRRGAAPGMSICPEIAAT
jgi:hypothetical protein